ncbi:patatin-like protein [Mycobacterium spongiae]|uniref:Patatin-like protein n=1 Tax=Mycobacterium spongiae TaxID=886343 RepID=A0A975JUV9_9MYCO|nr:patatin-like protein [Mycobacterium spongiae]QUR66135.1 patatin-like protein [Mycobacterium spongiae]
MALGGPSPVTERTQELRLATTMTGGVSLAIWMAGVAREINLLAQASQWRRVGGSFPADSRLSTESAASLRLYRELIDLLDLVVDVDILSGTSAGGINAALLAWSRVNGKDLGGLRDLWLDLGALTDLLRDPRDKNTPSLLYGDERMFAALATEIPKLDSGPFPPAAIPGDGCIPCTTVYITTTLLAGETSRFTDSFGTLVQDVNHRGLFTFTKAQLADDSTVPALALAARSSASFPLAFEPSFVPLWKPTPQKAKVPARPPMGHFTNFTRSHWVADGGLLDNQPINVLLKSVFDRPARRPVRRVLLYVVPSGGPAPDLVADPAPDNVAKPLGLVDALLKDLEAVTTQSIAADLHAIKAHQDRLEARTNTRLRLAELAVTLPEGSRLLTASLLTDYATREASHQAQTLTSALLRQLSSWPPQPATTTDSIPKKWEPELAVGADGEKACRRKIRDSMLGHWSPSPDEALPDGPADFARYGHAAFDIAKGLALSVIQAAYQLAASKPDIAMLGTLTERIHRSSPTGAPADPGELVRGVCTNPVLREGSLEDAAAKLACDYVKHFAVPADAWAELGEVFVTGEQTFRRLAANASRSPTDAQSDSLPAQESTAASQLTTYLNYLGPPTSSRVVAMKLFDMAATQRAMLPAETDIEQSLELVQVSADCRCLLAHDWQTAQQKLTGMQFHHFGAFYKRSWRANDWMWGRLDGAGWLVHVLLDPRRVLRLVRAREGADASEAGSRWFLGRLKQLGALDFPSPGYRLPASGDGSDHYLTENMVLKELEFLDDPKMAIPPSIPRTSLWLAQAWQQRVLDEELDGLANSVLDPQPGQRPDWSPTVSRTWATKVLAASPGSAKYALLNQDPVAKETLGTDKGSPLMAQTITKTAATASAAAGSVRQLPSVLKPPVITLQTLALGGYRAVSLSKGIAKWSLTVGAALLVLGVAATTQSATVAGVTGLIMAGTGGYLIVLATWQFSSRLLFALLSVTLVGAVLALSAPFVRRLLFGADEDPGLMVCLVYWFGERWWHPLIGVGAVALAIAVIVAAKPGRK